MCKRGVLTGTVVCLAMIPVAVYLLAALAVVAAPPGQSEPVALAPTANDQVDLVDTTAATSPTGMHNLESAASSAWQCDPSGGPACFTNLNAIAMVSAIEGWAVGDGGIIVHLYEGAWHPVASPTTANLRTIAMMASGEGWAMGESSTILHYVDGSWQAIFNTFGLDIYSFSMAAVDEGWAVGRGPWPSLPPCVSPGLRHYVAGEWRVPAYIGYGAYGHDVLSAVSMVSRSAGWMVGSDGYAGRYDGQNWQSIIPTGPGGGLRAVAAVSAEEAWAVGYNGSIRHFQGTAELDVASPVSSTLIAVTVSPAGEGWAVGDGGAILRYAAGSWQAATSPTSYALNAVAVASPIEAWAVGAGGTILHYTGGEWRSAVHLPGSNLSSVVMVSPGEGRAGGGTIPHYQDGTWQKTTSVASDHGALVFPECVYRVSVVAMVSPTEGWRVGSGNCAYYCPTWSGGTIDRYADGAWQSVYRVSGPAFYGVTTTSAGDVWVVGERGTILHYGGGQFRPVTSPTGATLRSVYMLSPTEGWAVGDNGALVHYAPGPAWVATEVDLARGDQTRELRSSDSSVRVTIPEAALPAGVVSATFRFTPVAPAATSITGTANLTGAVPATPAFALSAADRASGATFADLAAPITLTVSYEPDTSFVERGLRLYRRATIGDTWTTAGIVTQTLDTDNNLVVGQVITLGQFAVLGPASERVYLPVVARGEAAGW